ncbi:MAG: hypothetical protein GY952_12895 [Rhodobacteraceae bacterium]|nr:hypothetical protein [Paracoccaceae bacterium]
MESHPKVMTVSYGTFACTLEGFDDPFTTMQLVAEYFRKLAAEDRYFGGEPLQPDANTLHRIAKDANPNKVDAEVSDSGIILRQADVVDAPKSPAKVAAPEPRVEKPVVVPTEEPTKEEDSFVAEAVFSSRRSLFEPAEDEPAQPASQLLREEDEEAQDSADLDVQRAVEHVAETVSRASKPAPVAPKPAEDFKTEPEAKPEPAEPVAPAPAKLEKLQEIEPVEPAEELSQVINRAARLQELRQSDDIQREEEALERLLETTNTKLSAPSHARRSNALERLKAAVAATEAERRMRGSAKTNRPKVQDLSSEPENFRQEIRSVRKTHEDDMKITRPVVKRNGTSRRRASVTTLILDNDQRVDGSQAPETDPVKKKAGR